MPASLMKDFLRKLNELSDAALASGCLFLVPYLGFYLLFWFFGASVQSLTRIFQMLHLWFLWRCLALLWQNRAKGKSPLSIFWLFLAVVFFLPGAYLEYPADSWEHLHRIFAWEGYSQVGQFPVRQKFAYYWAYTWLGAVSISYRPIALDIYSTFWQLVIAVQVFRLFVSLGVGNSLSVLVVIAYFLGSGTEAFSLRYYALSSMMPALACYLYGLRFYLEHPFRWSHLALYGVLIVLMGSNHLQEVIFFGVMVGAAFFERRVRQRRGIFKFAVLFFGLFIFCLIAPQAWFESVQDLAGAGKWPGIAATQWESVQSFLIGGLFFPLFQGPFFATYGWVGVLTFALVGLSFFRRSRLLAVVCAPVFLCLYPPFVLALSAVTLPDTCYRILYAMPVACLLPVLFSDLFGTLLSKRPRLRWGLLFLVTLLIFAPARYQSGGRLFFQGYRVPSTLQLEDRLSVARWASKLPSDCRILTDHATASLISAHLRFPSVFVQTTPYRRDAKSTLHRSPLLNFWESEYGICALIVPIPSKVEAAQIPKSRMGALSGHWWPTYVKDSLWLPQDRYKKIIGLAKSLGWEQVVVHPGYKVYLKPK